MAGGAVPNSTLVYDHILSPQMLVYLAEAAGQVLVTSPFPPPRAGYFFGPAGCHAGFGGLLPGLACHGVAVLCSEAFG
jgi:hypothetical protein